MNSLPPLVWSPLAHAKKFRFILITRLILKKHLNKIVEFAPTDLIEKSQMSFKWDQGMRLVKMYCFHTHNEKRTKICRKTLISDSGFNFKLNRHA